MTWMRKPTRGCAIEGTSLWADATEHSTVLVCEHCGAQMLALGEAGARDLAVAHMDRHAKAFRFTAYQVHVEQPCRVEDCTDRCRTEGYCRAHRPKRLCDVEGCERPHSARGLCTMHDDRMRKNGTTDVPARSRYVADRGCTVEGCTRKHDAKGLCSAHYRRQWRKAEPKPRPAPEPKPAPKPRPVRDPLCVVIGCEGKNVAKRLCMNHYQQQRRINQRADAA